MRSTVPARDRAITSREVCEIGGFGKTKLFELLKNGELVGRKIGRRTVVLESDLNASRRDLDETTA